MATQTRQMMEALMDKVDAYLRERPEGDCACRKHMPTATMRGGPGWRSFYETPTWSAWTALAALGLKELDADPAPFRSAEEAEATEGCTDKTGVWLRRDPHLPVKTAAHELAHNVLSHVKLMPQMAERFESLAEKTGGIGGVLAAIVMEVVKTCGEAEAEATAFLVAAALGYPDGVVETTRGCLDYIASHAPTTFPPKRRAAVIAAAETILAAGSRQAAVAA